jgi:TfoX N-terminal domain
MGRSAIEDRLLARLSGLGEVSCRPLFGGLGTYWRGVIFGILFRDRLFLQVDQRSRSDYEAQGLILQRRARRAVPHGPPKSRGISQPAEALIHQQEDGINA